MERSKDWLRQAEKDLEHALHSIEAKDYEWACFSAQQSAEKAIKAVYQKNHIEAFGHSITKLLENLKEKPSDEIIECAKILDKFYIPTRYPNSFDTGAPCDYFTEKEAKEAIKCAEKIIRFCKELLK